MEVLQSIIYGLALCVCTPLIPKIICILIVTRTNSHNDMPILHTLFIYFSTLFGNAMTYQAAYEATCNSACTSTRRAAANGPATTMPRPGISRLVPIAATAPTIAPSVPPIAEPVPAPYVVLLPSSVSTVPSPKWRLRASSLMTTSTSSWLYPRVERVL